MENTSLTLLARLQADGGSDAWQRLFDLYHPLLIGWLKKYDVQLTDAEDLAQEVLLAVSKSLPSFEHNGRAGAFRSWLRTILVNRLRNYWRARDRHPRPLGGSSIEQRLAQLEDPASEMSQLWNHQHDQHVLKRLLEIVRSQFSSETWNIFIRVAMRGEKADFVARESGVSLNAVFIAKSRVLSRLRAESAGLVDSSLHNFSTDC